MKRLFIALMTLAAAVQSGPAISAAPEYSKGAAVALCKELLPGIPEANLGECTSYVMTDNNFNAFPAHWCDAFMEGDPDLFFSIFDSYSDCVRTMKDF
jgi:hypothetical protein